MKVSRVCWFAVVLVVLIVAVPADAGKPIDRPDPTVVGYGQLMTVVPDLGEAVETGNGRLWSHVLEVRDATFLKPHFVEVNLRAGDAIVVRSRTGHVVEVIEGRGPRSSGTFWGLSAMGDTLVVEFLFHHEYAGPPFRIDQAIVGEADLFQPPLQDTKSICTPEDFDDVFCYQGDAEKWTTVMGSVGVMNVGSNPTSGLWCSGSNVSPQNYLMTNAHCVGSQSDCNNAEFVFKYYRQGCNDGSPTTADWEGFHCDVQVALSPFVSCEPDPSQLDFSLNSVIGDPASTYGFVTPDPIPVTSGEAIYIVQHPSGRPHEITHGDGANVEVDGYTLRYYDTLDTEGGSSGSPIYRESDNKMIGLHHCGGCSTPGTGNRGMMMSDIYPLIEEFLCVPELALSSAGYQDVTQFVGNSNGVMEPGEIWAFTPRVSNNSCDVDADEVSADFALNAGSAGPVVLFQDDVDFGDVAAGSTAAGITEVRFMVDPVAVCGESVIVDLLNLTASNGGPFPGATPVFTRQLGEIVQTTILYEDFSGGIPAGWSVVDGGSGGGAAATWTTANPGGRSLALTEPFAIADSDEAGSGATMDEELISGVIDCSGYLNVVLQLSHDFNWYSGGLDEQGDVDVRSSATGGAWVTVQNFSGGDTSGTVGIDISAQAVGQSDVQLRFHYYNATYEYWWAVDDIYILGDNGFVCDIYDPGSIIFIDGFGSGDTSAWSATVQ